MAHTLTKGTMMSTKINLVNPPTHGLLQDTQDQINGNFGVSPPENASKVIMTQPIFTNLVNGKITSNNRTWFYTQKLRILFTKKDTRKLCKKYNQFHPQGGLEYNTTVFTY